MFHSLNQDYLLQLLAEIRDSEIKNPLILVTKGPLTEQVLERIRGIGELKLLFFLSYSGLPRHFEPNFARETLQRNFELTKTYGFSTIHYWRPLLPDNTTPQAIREMLSFSSSNADSVVFTGLKLHPKLTRSIMQGTAMSIPAELHDKTGEWLSHEVVDSIYHVAGEICPGFSIYPESVMKENPGIQDGVYLEAEESFPELVANFDCPDSVMGIYQRKEGAVSFTGNRKLPDFGRLPIPRRDFLDVEPYLSNIGSLGIQTKRGCPCKCIYCTYPRLNGYQIRIMHPGAV